MGMQDLAQRASLAGSAHQNSDIPALQRTISKHRRAVVTVAEQRGNFPDDREVDLLAHVVAAEIFLFGVEG